MTKWKESLPWIATRNLSLVLSYYVLSIGLTFFQNDRLKKIRFPLFIVLSHLILKFTMSSIFRLAYELTTNKKRILLKWEAWCLKLSLIGIPGGLEIAFSNWGQEFVTVSLYTMVKSTVIIFILAFAIYFKLEELHWSQVAIVGMISGGLVMFTYDSTQFNLLGVSLILLASFLSGLRWSALQMVIQKSNLGLQHPIDIIYHVQPWMILAVLPFALYFEFNQLSELDPLHPSPETENDVSILLSTILIGAFMAFFMEILEYLLVLFTSSLTFSVAGIFKEICTLTLAIEFKGDAVSRINFLGLLMCLAGIISHVVYKAIKSTEINFKEGGRQSVNKTVQDGVSLSNDIFIKEEDIKPLLDTEDEIDNTSL